MGAPFQCRYSDSEVCAAHAARSRPWLIAPNRTGQRIGRQFATVATARLFLCRRAHRTFERALRATRSAIFLSEPVASGIASQSWTIPGQEKRRSAPLDGLRRLGLERIQL